MTDKKLTDEEIIKRLEQCTKRGNRNYDTDIVLDLINRQKSEIERLNKQMEWLEGYNKNLMSGNTALSEEIWIAKAESYKEFAKLLIDKASEGLIHVSDLPDFVKEMVGEEE